MWILFALASALGLGFYDIMKKLSVRDNDVLAVLALNTLFGALLMSPVLVVHLFGGVSGLGGADGHLLILVKSMIVLGSWLLGYFAIKHLPLTIQGPINASRPVMVLVGAVLLFGERLNMVQWIGILTGFASLYFISRIGAREGLSVRHSRWILFAVGAAVLGAVSALYDKYLLRRFDPLNVQAWYALYQCVIMGGDRSLVAAVRSSPRRLDLFSVAMDHSVYIRVPDRCRLGVFLCVVAARLDDFDRVDDSAWQRARAVSLWSVRAA